MKGDRRTAAVGVPVLAMRATLPNLSKPETLQKSHHFPWLQNRKRTHTYATRIV